MFVKPNDRNLTANGGNGYNHNNSQYGYMVEMDMIISLIFNM